MNSLELEVVAFVHNCILHEGELYVPITPEDAAYNMKYWDADGVEYPEGMTPEMFAETWNRLIMEV